MRILVTGAGGLLGSALAREGDRRGHEVVALSRTELDITEPVAVHAAVREAWPDVIVNCAAFSNVDRAETEQEEALAVNRDGARYVAEASAESGALMVHIGTDYIFDGRKVSPYLPSDQPAPLNVYGISKLAGEVAVREAGADLLLVRTSWIFGERDGGFVGFIRKAVADSRVDSTEPLRIVTNETSRPTWSEDLGPALLDLVGKGIRGCVHLANGGSCTRLELATEIREIVGGGRPMVPITSEEFGAPARRPVFSVLDLSAAETALGGPLPHWKEALRRFLNP
ncbi:dTDP-4-dehydrorhamnose reductase [Gemmatimonadota bacterium]